MHTVSREGRRSEWRWTAPLALVGVLAAGVALVGSPHAARAAAGQTWTPFVLVAGLLLIGLVAERDGLFEAAGSVLARMTRHGVGLCLGAGALVIVVTAGLNLDRPVVFVTAV